MFKFGLKLTKNLPSLRSFASSSGPSPPIVEGRLPDTQKCINKIILMGRCVGESQTRTLSNGLVSWFVIATNELRKTKSNELVRRSDYHKVYVYQPFLAQKVAKLMVSGTRVYLEGKLNYRKKDTVHYANIVAEKVIFISGTAQGVDAEDADLDEIDESFLPDHENDKNEEEAHNRAA